MNKILKKDKELLTEAYRRFNKFPDKVKSMKQMWLGLGYSSEYKKSKYFEPSHNLPRSRCLGWWCLSDKGVKVLKQLLNKNTWTEKSNSELFTNSIELVF